LIFNSNPWNKIGKSNPKPIFHFGPVIIADHSIFFFVFSPRRPKWHLAHPTPFSFFLLGTVPESHRSLLHRCAAVRRPSPRPSGWIELPSRSLHFPLSLGANPLTSSPVTGLHLKTHYHHPVGRLPSPSPPPRPYITQLCLGHLPRNTLRHQTLLLRASTCSTQSSTAAIFFSPPLASPRRHTNPWSSRWVWQNHLRNEGFVSQDHIGGFSTKRECVNTHI
jgi:hypothetical protein